MRLIRSVTTLFLVAACLYLVSYPACREGHAHDQSGFCVIRELPPPYLGFEYWSEVGLVVSVMATGLLIAAVTLWRDNWK